MAEAHKVTPWLRVASIAYGLLALALAYLVSPIAPPSRLGGTVVAILLVLGAIPLAIAQIAEMKRADPVNARAVQTRAGWRIVLWLSVAAAITWIETWRPG